MTSDRPTAAWQVYAAAVTMKLARVHSGVIRRSGYTAATTIGSVEIPSSILEDGRDASVGLVLQTWRPDELKRQNSTDVGAGVIDFSLQTERQGSFVEVRSICTIISSLGLYQKKLLMIYRKRGDEYEFNFELHVFSFLISQAGIGAL